MTRKCKRQERFFLLSSRGVLPVLEGRRGDLILRQAQNEREKELVKNSKGLRITSSEGSVRLSVSDRTKALSLLFPVCHCE